MKAVESNFLKFLQGQKQFRIPIYQRTYSWTVRQCEQLWNDIINIVRNDRVQGHFIGSVVYIQGGIYQSSTVSELVVINGQQRLTTLSLLLKALGKALDELKIEGPISSRKITNYYLLNNEEGQDLRHKLILTRADEDTFINLLEDRELSSEYSQQIVQNYKFFQEQIHKNGIDLPRLYDGINKLFIIDVSLEREKDNPQLIFESLNSTGLELSQADLVRNYILMGLEPNEQQRIYTEYWFPMETDFEQQDYTTYFNRFMRDFLTIEIGKIPNIGDVYSEFKSYMFANKNRTLYDIVKKIRHYSKLFVKLAYAKEEDPEINQLIEDINELEVEVSYPFLMVILDDYSKGILSRENLCTIMQLVESYVFRRAICQIPTASLNKTFANLIKQIDRDNHLESVKAALMLNETYKRFPSDEEFKNQFPYAPLYNRPHLTEHTLRKLENFHHKKEPISVENYTVEHILPQKAELPKDWIDELGDDWKQIHQKYVHTIGNLTLTGYNSELSYLPFLQKRDIQGGFSSSPLWLNHSLSTLEHWNKDEIEKRAKALTEIALKIWPMPYMSIFDLERYRQKIESKDKANYTEEDHFETGSEYTKHLYKVLKPAILSISPDVECAPKKRYIAFLHNRNFVDVVFYRSQLNLYLNIKKGTLRDPKGIAKDVSLPGHWGNGDYVIILKDAKSIEDALRLIRQSYEEN